MDPAAGDAPQSVVLVRPRTERRRTRGGGGRRPRIQGVVGGGPEPSELPPRLRDENRAQRVPHSTQPAGERLRRPRGGPRYRHLPRATDGQDVACTAATDGSTI